MPVPTACAPRRLWPVAGVLVALAHLLLLVPDNPVLDLGKRQYRDEATVVSHVLALLVLATCWPWRHRWLELAARADPRRRAAAIAAAAVLPQLALRAIDLRWPRYSRVLTHEWGFTEPASVALYVATAWLACRTAQLRRSQGLPWKPYRLAAVGSVLLALEELDYFGLFNAVVGRVGRIYVGSFHDLLKLASHYPATLVLVAALGVVALLAVWRFGGLSWSFLWAEARSASSWPIYLGVAATAVAEVVDVKGEVPPGLAPVFRREVEEALELLGAFLLLSGILLKYCRHRPESA